MCLWLLLLQCTNGSDSKVIRVSRERARTRSFVIIPLIVQLTLNIYRMMYHKKTKIVATIGPASQDVDILRKMIHAGLNVARINFSHGDHDSAAGQIANVREAAKSEGAILSVMQDLSGPKIRTGDFENGEVVLKRGSEITITTKKVLGTATHFTVNCANLLDDVEIGERILINDGKQSVRVTKIGKDALTAKVVYGGMVRSRRGVNLPDTKLSVSAITTKDKRDLAFGVSQGVDFVAQSFVRNAYDVEGLRKLLKKHGSDALIVVKIETPSAVEHFDEILAATDAVMVARGDMAVEIGTEKVPGVQKMILEKCNAAGKPAIVATQMMESMIHAPVPTRAEVTDVSHAVYTGADAVMLSEESAMGEYPVETVKMMAKIAVEAEHSLNHAKFVRREYVADKRGEPMTIDDAISRYCAKTAYDIDASVIVALTESGKTARLVSRYKPEQPLLVLSPYENILRQTQLSFGAVPILFEGEFNQISDVVAYTREYLLKQKYAKKGEKAVIAVGVPFGTSGGTNTVHAIEV